MIAAADPRRVRPAALPARRAVMLPDGKFHRPRTGIDYLLFGVVPFVACAINLSAGGQRLANQIGIDAKTSTPTNQKTQSPAATHSNLNARSQRMAGELELGQPTPCVHLFPPADERFAGHRLKTRVFS